MLRSYVLFVLFLVLDTQQTALQKVSYGAILSKVTVYNVHPWHAQIIQAWPGNMHKNTRHAKQHLKRFVVNQI